MRRRISKLAGFSPALRRLGLALPPPFVGRSAELQALAQALGESSTIMVTGAVGAGKTRLARALLAGELGLRPAYVRCTPGDRAVAVRARAERGLALLPGGLDDALAEQPILVVIDDAHHLAEADFAASFHPALRRGGVGRCLFLTRDRLVLPPELASSELVLEGLDEAAARELWAHLEDTYGPTPAGACDRALGRTRGMPLAMRREYALSAFGDDAWDTGRLSDPARAALEVCSVVAIPVAPAAVAALHDGPVEDALIELVSRQLIDPQADGRFAVHDIIRDQTLAQMTAERRREREQAAATLVASTGHPGAWPAGDVGALGLVCPVERLREEVGHWLAAGDTERAIGRIADGAALLSGRGATGELVALLERAEAATGRRVLPALQIALAARRGEIGHALALGEGDDPVLAAELALRAGDVGRAVASLGRLLAAPDPEVRARAAALTAEVELHRGATARARAVVVECFERDRAALGDLGRARLHLAFAAIEEREGALASARVSLARAAAAAQGDLGLAARIEARRVRTLIEEGRIAEAEVALAAAEKVARETDELATADELAGLAALVVARRGELGRATTLLVERVAARRRAGDELGALAAELELARILVERGELGRAGELAAAVASSASARSLAGLAGWAALVAIEIDVADLRAAQALAGLAALGALAASDAALAREVARLGARLLQLGKQAEAGAGSELERLREAVYFAVAAGQTGRALEQARGQVAVAERNGRAAEVLAALAVIARFELARGDREAAALAATRAAREAAALGATRTQCQALLILAALAHDTEEPRAALAYAQDAAALAGAARLSIERLAAERAVSSIAFAGATGPTPAVAATMSEAARDAAERLLTDLGLTLVRPFRVISADGEESRVADASADRLRLADRDLVVDGVREAIVRKGQSVADLRRRSLLKRLLFLFAAQPGRTFSKEEIVQTVWEVEYHPLRHDAALFTNIMRIRRLLGKDGAEVLRVSEEGYRFCPGKDFLFVEPC